MSEVVIVAGKRYVTNSGWITPPIEFDNEFMEDYPFFVGQTKDECSIGIQSWTPNGLCHSRGTLKDGADLVAEYVPECSVPGVPEGWRVVRFGVLQVGEWWIPPGGIPIENTIPTDKTIANEFHCLIVERIHSA